MATRTSKRLVFIFMFWLSVFTLTFSFAQEEEKQNTSIPEQEAPITSPTIKEEPAPAIKEEPAPAIKEEPANAPPQPQEENKITLDFKEVDIQSVLRILAEKGGVNIVSGKDVAGPVTIKLIDISWEKALDVILQTYGYGYERISDKVLMVSTLSKIAEGKKAQLEALTQQKKAIAEAAEAESTDTEIFSPNFLNAEDIKKSIEGFITKRGKITIESRTNTIIVSDTKSNLKEIEKMVKSLDRITPQVAIEAKIIETTLGSADKLGIDWTIKATASGAARPITAPFINKWSDSKYYPIPTHTVTTDFIQDKTQPKVPQPDGTYDWPYIKQNTITSDFPYRGSATYPGDLKFSSFPGATADQFTFGTLDFSQFSAVLEILKSRADTKIISNPRITTVNNQEAKILVGSIVPIPLYQFSEQTGVRMVSGYQDQKIGIELVVTPEINERDYVTLKVKPSVDEITSFTGPNNERPIISTRSAEAKVMIKDGQTLAMGGLISEKKIKSRKKVPILGDLPLLGSLFSKKEDTVDKTDLLIFITPHIIKQN